MLQRKSRNSFLNVNRQNILLEFQKTLQFVMVWKCLLSWLWFLSSNSGGNYWHVGCEFMSSAFKQYVRSALAARGVLMVCQSGKKDTDHLQMTFRLIRLFSPCGPLILFISSCLYLPPFFQAHIHMASSHPFSLHIFLLTLPHLSLCYNIKLWVFKRKSNFIFRA